MLLLAIALAFVASCGPCNGGGSTAPTPAPPTPTARPPSTGGNTPAARDLIDLARRYLGRPDLPRAVDLPAPVPGEQQDFVLLDLPDSSGAAPARRTVSATLRAVSDHAYFFVQSDSDVGDAEVEDAVASFEGTVWPAITDEFGLPPTPGVDGDPRIAILHVDLGSGLGGYVSGRDAYPTDVVPASNGREMLYINVGIRPLGSPGYTGIVAHEFQHLVHRALDDDDETWLNEGLSEVAASLAGGGGGAYRGYLDAPDLQLNDWSATGDNGGHYDAADLFLTYLIEQTPLEPGSLARNAANGLEGVATALEEAGSSRSLDELLGDWAVANLLGDSAGRYGYLDRTIAAPAVESIAGPGRVETDVHQLGIDYLELTSAAFPSGATLHFQGEPLVRLIDAQTPGQIETLWWSGRGDALDSTLTRELDLTGVSKATLTFRTWFDTERWFDYGYVSVSRDGGATWQALSGRHTTTDDPLQAAFGPGYTGRSGGGGSPRWVDERIDLSAYAGAKVLLRFELINDEGVSGPGWAIDDIAVPEIGFFDDAESDPGGWRREGFRLISNPVRQRFELRVVTLAADRHVRTVTLDAGNGARVDLPGLGTEYDRAYLVVMATTDGTTERAKYRYDVEPGVPTPVPVPTP